MASLLPWSLWIICFLTILAKVLSLSMFGPDSLALKKFVRRFIMVEKLKEVHIEKAKFLILNCRDIALLRNKTKFNVRQKCLLLHVKHSCNNIGLIDGSLFLEELARYLLLVKICCKHHKNNRFTKITDNCYCINVQLLHWAITFQIYW